MVTESVSFQGTGGRGPNKILSNIKYQESSTMRIFTFYILCIVVVVVVVVVVVNS